MIKNFNEEFIAEAGVIEYTQEEKNIELALDEDNYDDRQATVDIVLAALEAAVKYAKENKSKEEPLAIKFGDMFTIKIEYREGNDGDGNFITSIEPDNALKASGKKEYSDDDDEEDEDDE